MSDLRKLKYIMGGEEMLSKKEKIIGKIVKKNYNNELEEVLEKKLFDEHAKNLLLSILYKIEAGYEDYEKVKVDTIRKEEYIKNFISIIDKNCDNIKIVKLKSEEDDILGNKTFLVDKENKRIICYPIERKLLYCIYKISKNTEIINNNYEIIGKPLSNLINTGKCIEQVEPLRDFNGYSWTTVSSEIESIEHNLIFQNLRLLLGNKFLNNWVENKEFIIDYMELLKNRLEEQYGKKASNKIIGYLEKLAILLEIKFNPKEQEKLLEQEKEVQEKLEKIKDREKFVEMLTNDKKRLAEEIKYIDETINNKELLQNEYIKRNEKLPLQQKIFSARILSNMMLKEREEKISELEKLNELMNPKKFIKYKKEYEEKSKYLKIAKTKEIQKEIEKNIKELQKEFLKCLASKIDKIETKQDCLDIIYNFRYYNLLPYNKEINIYEVEEIKKEIKETQEKIILKANELKVIVQVSKNENINYEILKNIFQVRTLILEDLNFKVIKEKEGDFAQFFDENTSENKIKLANIENITKKDLEIKLNKKIKVFN
mgnify:FL=1